MQLEARRFMGLDNENLCVDWETHSRKLVKEPFCVLGDLVQGSKAGRSRV